MPFVGLVLHLTVESPPEAGSACTFGVSVVHGARHAMTSSIDAGSILKYQAMVVVQRRMVHCGSSHAPFASACSWVRYIDALYASV